MPSGPVIKPHAIVYGKGYKYLTNPGYLIGYRILTGLLRLLLFAHISLGVLDIPAASLRVL